MTSHVMLDLETLDTNPTAVVTAVGAVFFDPYSQKIGNTFYRVLTDWNDQQKKGRTISGDTVRWWLEQSEEARIELTSPGPVSAISTTGLMLLDFAIFLEGTGFDLEIWGNGADFDNVILGGLYGSYGIQRPWSYSKNRCYRTMNSLPKTKHFMKPKRRGTHHNALDDALTQAVTLQAIFADQRK